MSLTAVVEEVDAHDVYRAHLSGPANDHVVIWNGNDGGFSVLGEGIPAAATRDIKHPLIHTYIHTHTVQDHNTYIQGRRKRIL